MSEPGTICKIEDISPLQKFNTKNITINTSIKNSNKKYQGIVYEKPNISDDIYEKINDNLKQELKNFCKKYDYNYLLNHNYIKYFKIYGERNSGTNFLTKLLLKNTTLIWQKPYLMKTPMRLRAS